MTTHASAITTVTSGAVNIFIRWKRPVEWSATRENGYEENSNEKETVYSVWEGVTSTKCSRKEKTAMKMSKHKGSLIYHIIQKMPYVHSIMVQRNKGRWGKKKELQQSVLLPATLFSRASSPPHSSLDFFHFRLHLYIIIIIILIICMFCRRKNKFKHG